MKSKLLISLALVLILTSVGCTKSEIMSSEETEKMTENKVQEIDEKVMVVDNSIMKKMDEMTFDYSGELVDVSGGSATGTAMATFENGQYSLKATFKNLPDPQGSDFYEGWIVRRGSSFSVLSTGVAKIVDGAYINTYSSSKDLTDHDFYVLTIEPDDGDPAPAGHVLEGTMDK
jgi:hypothetical protein